MMPGLLLQPCQADCSFELFIFIFTSVSKFYTGLYLKSTMDNKSPQNYGWCIGISKDEEKGKLCVSHLLGCLESTLFKDNVIYHILQGTDNIKTSAAVRKNLYFFIVETDLYRKVY